MVVVVLACSQLTLANGRPSRKVRRVASTTTLLTSLAGGCFSASESLTSSCFTRAQLRRPDPEMTQKSALRPFLEQITAKLREYEPKGDDKPGFVPDWDEYFYAVAQAVALRSKDKGRKVGAVVVGEGHVILSTGFNGFARGIRETPERTADDEKLRWVTHAETNAIFNAARSGIPLVGSTLYVTTYPCAGCAQAIVQAGITRVFTYGPYWIKADNANRYEIAPDILAEAHVAIDAPQIRAEEVTMWMDKDRERRDAGADKKAVAEKKQKANATTLRRKFSVPKPAARVGRRSR